LIHATKTELSLRERTGVCGKAARQRQQWVFTRHGHSALIFCVFLAPGLSILVRVAFFLSVYVAVCAARTTRNFWLCRQFWREQIFQTTCQFASIFSVAKKIEVETIHRDGLTANNVPSSDCRFWDFVFIPG